MSEQKNYLHGYSKHEQDRLYHQAKFLRKKVYANLDISGVKNLLEVGSGVGAQTEILLKEYPELKVIGIDSSEEQIKKAKIHLSEEKNFKERFRYDKMDAENIFFDSDPKLNGAFFCWVLEHVKDPIKILTSVKNVLSSNSKIFITEVLNSSLFIEPYSPNLLEYWFRFNDLQIELGGDPYVGAKLGNYLLESGYIEIETNIETFHLDNRHQKEKEEMLSYWTNLLLSGFPVLLEKNKITKLMAEKAKSELKHIASHPDSVFFYSFVQATARTP